MKLSAKRYCIVFYAEFSNVMIVDHDKSPIITEAIIIKKHETDEMYLVHFDKSNVADDYQNTSCVSLNFLNMSGNKCDKPLNQSHGMLFIPTKNIFRNDVDIVSKNKKRTLNNNGPYN